MYMYLKQSSLLWLLMLLPQFVKSQDGCKHSSGAFGDGNCLVLGPVPEGYQMLKIRF